MTSNTAETLAERQQRGTVIDVDDPSTPALRGHRGYEAQIGDHVGEAGAEPGQVATLRGSRSRQRRWR